MKSKLSTAICTLALALSATRSVASEGAGVAVAADALVVRPVCLVATAVGSVLFVVSLPWSAPSRSIKSAAHVLVVRPARATFQRPLGDMEALRQH